MKKSLTDYASALAESDFKILEEIIDKKYRKFVRSFQLIKDHSSEIAKIKYDESDSDTLSIAVEFTKTVKLDDKSDLIKEMESTGYAINYKITGKKIKLTIKKEE